MSNPNRRKGTEWESRLAAFFTRLGTFAREVLRAPAWGTADKGDLLNTRDFVVQAKAVKAIDLAAFMDATQEQKRNAGRRWGVCIVKRKNSKTERAYAVMELGEWAELVKEFYEKEDD